MIAEVPTMAIDMVEVEENSTGQNTSDMPQPHCSLQRHGR
jgi:hypothetical protein